MNPSYVPLKLEMSNELKALDKETVEQLGLARNLHDDMLTKIGDMQEGFYERIFKAYLGRDIDLEKDVHRFKILDDGFRQVIEIDGRSVGEVRQSMGSFDDNSYSISASIEFVPY